MSPNSESEGELLIGEDSVFFVADEAVTDANYTQVALLNFNRMFFKCAEQPYALYKLTRALVRNIV